MARQRSKLRLDQLANICLCTFHELVYGADTHHDRHVDAGLQVNMIAKCSSKSVRVGNHNRLPVMRDIYFDVVRVRRLCERRYDVIEISLFG